MIPEPGDTLAQLAMRLATRIAPALTDRFAQADAGLLTGLLLAMAQDYERAVDARMRDISEMQQLFADAPAAAPAASARQAFMTRQPTSYHLKDVTALHGEGFALLIELHGWAEQHDDALNLAIWRLLRAHSERHKFEIPGT